MLCHMTCTWQQTVLIDMSKHYPLLHPLSTHVSNNYAMHLFCSHVFSARRLAIARLQLSKQWKLQQERATCSSTLQRGLCGCQVHCAPLVCRALQGHMGCT